MNPAVGYVRVSRVGGRSGDRFISPDVQAEAIEALARRERLEIVETITELDASGADATRPGWQRALSMVESGKVAAVCVYNLSRFSRSQVDAIRAIDRITAAGGQLHSALEGTFENSAAGTLLRDTLLRFAQFERDRATENFAVAQANAIERGIFTAAKIPVGYTRDPQTRKLFPDPMMAPVVKRLFEKRVDGESWTELARWLIDNGGSSKTDRTAVKWIIQNVTYLGYSRSGAMLNKKAHEPIITQLLFDRANAIKGRKPRHDGSLSSQTLLGGLVICEGCGHRLAITRFRDQVGYACRTVNCDASAATNARKLDSEVVSRILAYRNRYRDAAYYPKPDDLQGAPPAIETQINLEAAQYDLHLFISNREIRRLLPQNLYNAELQALTDALNEARIAHDNVHSPARQAPMVEKLSEVWETWTDESRREWLRTSIRNLIVRSAHRRRIPVSQRMALRLEGTLEASRWLLPNGYWSNAPFHNEPREASKLGRPDGWEAAGYIRQGLGWVLPPG